MGIYKEEAYEIEKIYRLQTRIYPDAADFGFAVTGFNDERLNGLKDALDSLKGSLKSERSFVAYGTGKTSTTSIFIPWEQDEEGLFWGTEYVIEYVHTKPEYSKKMDTDYVTIYMTRISQTGNPFKN